MNFLKTLLFLSFLLHSGIGKTQSCNDSSIQHYLTKKWEDVNLIVNDSIACSSYQKFVFGKKEIFFFGTVHNVRNSQHRMYSLIDSTVEAFKPTIILAENYQHIYKFRDEAITNSGDVGFTYYLAKQKKHTCKKLG